MMAAVGDIVARRGGRAEQAPPLQESYAAALPLLALFVRLGAYPIPVVLR